MVIVYDRREERSGVPAMLEAMGFALERATLPAADYVLSRRLVVLRRTERDLLPWVAPRRLYGPVAQARADAAVVVVIVQRRPVDVRFTAVRGDVRAATIARTIRQGAPLLDVEDAGEVAGWIARLARQEEAPADGWQLSMGRKAPDLDGLVEQVVAWFPGVSFVGARRLLERFRTLERLVTASEAEIREVRGFGPKRAAAIVQLARHCYRCTPPGTEPDLAAIAAADPAIGGGA